LPGLLYPKAKSCIATCFNSRRAGLIVGGSALRRDPGRSISKAFPPSAGDCDFSHLIQFTSPERILENSIQEAVAVPDLRFAKGSAAE
jgi:hypothetical protein